MKDSILDVQRKLGLTSEEVTALKQATRSWLERRYASHSRVAEIPASDLQRLAIRFLQKNGSILFSGPIKAGRVTGTGDSRLISKMISVLSCQREYSRKVTAREARILKKIQSEQRLENSDCSDVESASSGSSSATNQASTDGDYAPSHGTPVITLPKIHNTRMNAQPGMPVCQSIETATPERPGETVSGQFTKLMAKRRFGEASNIEVSDFSAPTSLMQRSGTMDTANSIEPSGRFSRMLSTRSASTPTAQCRQQNIDGDSRLVTQPAITIATNVPLTQTSMAGSASGAATVQLASASQPSSTMLDVTNINFDQFLTDYGEFGDDPEMSSESLAWLSSPPRDNRFQAPRCEQTPPSSAKPVAEARSQRSCSSLEIDEKPQMNIDARHVIDLTLPDEEKIFIGDHSVVIKKDRAVRALQSILDFIDQQLREHRRTSQRLSASFQQRREAEQYVALLCEMINSMRHNPQIWDGGSPSKAFAKI